MTFWVGFLLGASVNALLVILFVQLREWREAREL